MSAGEPKKDEKVAATGTDTSTRDDAEADIIPREDIDVSVDGREERDGPPDAPQQQNSIEGRDAAPEGGGEALQKPYIVRRKSQQSLALEVYDKDPSGELMIDPSAPPPAWCANITVVDDSAYYEAPMTPESDAPQTMTSALSATAASNFSPSVYATAAPSPKPKVSPAPQTTSESFTDNNTDLMTSASEDAAARPTSPFGLRMTRSEECFSSPSKRESASPAKSAKKARSRPSPEMGMRPPRRATASGNISALKGGSPKPEDMPRRPAADNTSPGPSRRRASPKPPRPHGHSVLGSLIGESKKGTNTESQRSINPFDQHLSAEPSVNESKGSSPNPFDQFAPVFPPLDKGGESEAAKVKQSASPAKESPFSVLDRAVVTIQSAIRGHLARQEALIRMGSIVMIQSAIRRHRAVVEGFSRRGAIVSIQAWYRGELVRTELEYLRWCAIEIQSSWRQHVARRDFGSTRAKLIVAQTAWRSHIAKKNYRLRREQIIKIQTLARQRSAEKRLKTSRTAAASIQASVRGAACRKEYKKAVSSAILIQSVARGLASRKDYIATIQAVVRLQSIARQKVARNQFDISRSAASTIQASFRGAMCRREFEKTISSLILIQAFARTSLARGQYFATIEAAVRLQAFARKVEVEKRYQSVLSGVIKLQAAARRISAQGRYHATRQIAVASQTFARGTKARRDFLLAIESVVLLQSTARMSSEQKKYASVCSAIIRVQTFCRRILAEREMARRKVEARVAAEQNHAAVVVQSYWRRFVAKETFAESLVSVMLIQMYWRRHQAISKVERMKLEKEQRLQREREEKERNAAILIQSTWRGYYHEMAYVDAIIAATIIQAYTRRYMSQREYQKEVQIYREEQAREQQRAAEHEALRRSAMAVQRRKLEQERLEGERLRREERERIEQEQQRLEEERLRQQECERIEQQRQKELVRLEAERRTREEEKEKEELQADIVAEFEVEETQKNVMKSEVESRRRIQVQKQDEIERSAVQAPEGPMSPPKRSVVAAGASPSIKDRIRMFSGGGAGTGTASPSPVPLGRSPCKKSTFGARSPVIVSERSTVVNETTDEPIRPKSPLPKQNNNFENGPNIRQSRFKPANNSSSPVPARPFVGLQAKAASPVRKPAMPRSPVGPSTNGSEAATIKQISPPRPSRSETINARSINTIMQPILSPGGSSPSPRKSLELPSVPSSAKDPDTSLKQLSPRKAHPKVSEGGTFDFNQLKKRFDNGNKSAVTEPASGNGNGQMPSKHQSPKFKRTIKTKIVAWDAPQGPTTNQVTPRAGERVKMEASVVPKFDQSLEPQNKIPLKQCKTVVSQPANENGGWEDFGRTPTFASTFGSTSWKKPQAESRNDTESCPDDVLNSFKQIQASAAMQSLKSKSTLTSPTARPSPKISQRETNEFVERPSNVFKLRPSHRDTPTVDHHNPSQLSSPSSKPRAVSQTRGKAYHGDNSLRRERRMHG